MEKVKEFGFDIGEFGQNTVVVNEAPENVPDNQIESLVTEIAESFYQNLKKQVSGFEEKILDMISCKGAIKANDRLNESEVLEVIRQVNELYESGIKTCPHGRPIVAQLSKTEIEKMFKRIV